MSAAGHGGLSPRALSRTHAGQHITRNGAKIASIHTIFSSTEVLKTASSVLNITPKPCCYRCYKISIMADVSAL